MYCVIIAFSNGNFIQTCIMKTDILVDFSYWTSICIILTINILDSPVVCSAK